VGTDRPNPKITRHFVTIGDRQVHYRRVGSGPPVVLLHQSPKSGREMIPVAEALANDFTLIILDTPGNGNSDPIGLANPIMEDYGDNVALVLDALGIEKVGVYGFHTGAGVGGAFASRHPDRVHVAILNGFVALTNDERDDFLAHYLPEFHPVWDGSHLTWLWARLREQMIFFPWHRASRASRSGADMPSPDSLHAGVLEFLRSGDEYRNPYGAAFKFKGDECATRFSAPTYICASDWDALSLHLDRLPNPLPDCVTIERLGPDREAVTPWVRAKLKEYVKGPDAPPAPEPKPVEGRTWQDFVTVDGGQLHVRRTNSAGGAPVLVQHGTGNDNAVIDAVTRSLTGKRTAFAFDLPGHGESDNVTDGDTSVEGTGEVLGQAIAALGLDGCDIFGMLGGGLAALDLAIRQPKQVRHLAIYGAADPDPTERAELLEKYVEPIVPDWYGGHLIKAWHTVRDRTFYFPWYRRTNAGIIWHEPDVDSVVVHGRLVALLKAGDTTRPGYQANITYPVRDKLREVKVPVHLYASDGKPFSDQTKKVAEDAGCPYGVLQGGAAAWSDDFLRYFADK
jgi:pimeloyl-ACP methyl ester carboxylesterase